MPINFMSKMLMLRTHISILLIIFALSFSSFGFDGNDRATRASQKQSNASPITSATLAAQQAPSRRAVEKLRKDLDEIFADPLFKNALWGAAVASIDSGQSLYELNAEKGFMPASNMKLFTTAAALDRLGPDFRYETRLLSTDVQLDDGRIDGDLLVIGSGDPSFAARFHDNNSLAPLQAWAKELKKRGITVITGDIVGDDERFDDQTIPEGWSRSYLTDWYAAQVNALSLNDNCQDIFVTPGKVIGAPVKWRVVPDGVFGEIRMLARTVAAGKPSALRFSRRPGTNIVEISGTLALDASDDKESITVCNPTLFFTHHLKRALTSVGIEVKGSPKDLDDLGEAAFHPSTTTLLAKYTSPPLSEIIETINKKSQNLYAEQLLKTLGAYSGKGGGYKEGATVVKDFLKKNGVDTIGFFMADGSGLSRINLVQPRQTLALLSAMASHQQFIVYLDSLPVAGIDGSITNRMREGATRGNLRAKTGLIRRVVALSGYVTTPEGEHIAFSFMVNNFTVSERTAKSLIDRAAKRLAEFQRYAPK